MKKSLIAIALMLTLSMNVDAAAQKHRHTPRTEQVDSTQNSQDAIEAFSDTTTVADADANNQVVISRQGSLSDEDIKGVIDEVLDNIDGKDVLGVFLVLGALAILFLGFPIIIIIGVVYLINRNRKEKYKLAQMAVQNGQPIPEQLLEGKKDEWDRDDYAAGMRQLFLGIGLMFFLGYTAGKVGFGIGALVFCIGLGKVVIAKTSQKKSNNQINNEHYE